ncbi:uncharacterized protein LOC127103874 [Lathyrus oleraceus]|uniref:uncharacterized protein LOC127103874 n=1 Tax=Pisum sativum TaxID=3888 RepID=UPI0021CFA237|nr:uncharacterized protein LOC127103874 [Pisum sativum]
MYCVAHLQHVEEVNYLKQNNPYFNTYNPSSKNHPNFSWKDQQGNIQKQDPVKYQNQQQFQPQQNFQNQFLQQHQQQAPQKVDWEITTENMVVQNAQFQEDTRNNQRNTTSTFKNLEVQVGQIAQQLSNQAQGTLPSATIQNPRNRKNINVVTIRSQKLAKDEEDKATNDHHVIEVDMEVRENKKEPKEAIPPAKPTKEKTKKEAKSVIKLPYPQRVTKKDLKEKYFEKFITIFKILEINMSFFKALEEMPMYQKFMKEVISKKRPIRDGPVTFNEKFSAISPGRRIPIKHKDPRSVTVPWTIKDKTFKKVLIDSGASVSLMPLSVYQRLGIRTVNDTRTVLKFADHSINNAYEVAEDVLVTMEQFSFPVDFVIMDILEDEKTPIILGRPFLWTSRCNFDIE